VAKAQGEICSREFGEWTAYESLSPGEPERSDLQTALVACTVANVMRGKKGRPFRIKDFLLKFDLPERKTVEEIKMKLALWKNGLNKKLEKDKKVE